MILLINEVFLFIVGRYTYTRHIVSSHERDTWSFHLKYLMHHYFFLDGIEGQHSSQEMNKDIKHYWP